MERPTLEDIVGVGSGLLGWWMGEEARWSEMLLWDVEGGLLGCSVGEVEDDSTEGARKFLEVVCSLKSVEAA